MWEVENIYIEVDEYFESKCCMSEMKIVAS